MTRLLLTFLTLLFIAAPVQAESKQTIIDIKVLGMVCDFCAQSVWKVFQDYDEVADVDINLDTGIVSVFLKQDRTLSDEKLNQAITYAGYELVDITKREAE